MQNAIDPNPLVDANGRYEKVQNLGQGSFGFVQLGKSVTGELAAIKVSSDACSSELLRGWEVHDS